MQKRLDLILFEKELFKTKEKAKEGVLQGIVYLNDKQLLKPGQKFEEALDFKIVGQKLKYVSRAGLKLEKAKEYFNINFFEKVVLDAGASTGGFTDFCLQNGAKKVYAVDVGTNQLNETIKTNPKVISLEKTDIRSLTKKSFAEDIDIIVCDVSFISLTKVLPKFYELIDSEKQVITLIKPQFEVGKQIASKNKGVIKDAKVAEYASNQVVDFAKTIGFDVVGVTKSPILGTAGNVEFLAYFIKN